MDQCLAIQLPPSPLRALLLQKSDWLARVSSDFRKADMLLQRAIEMSQEIGDTNRSACALMDVGLSARDQGDGGKAISCFWEALKPAQEGGDQRGIGNFMYFLAESYSSDFDRAISLWEQGLAIHRAEGDRTHIAWGLEGLAGVAYLQRDFTSALKFHLESLRLKAEVMDKLGMAYSFEGLAQVAAAEEEPERASILWGAANHLRETMKIPLDPSRAELYTSLIPGTRDQIGEELFAECWRRGQRMQLAEAIEYARQA